MDQWTGLLDRLRAAIVVTLTITAGSAALVNCSNPIAPDCTVGYAGTDLNVEVQGPGADSTCQQLITTAPAASPDQTPLGSGYDRQPGGTLMCKINLSNLTYTVRDSGALKLYGTAVCGSLQQQTPEAQKAAQAAADQQARDQAAAAAQQARDQAAAAAQQAVQQLADASAAVDHSVASVIADYNSVAGDPNSYSGLYSAIDRDVKRTFDDTTVTYAALQKVMSEARNSLSCGVDANTVGVDSNTVAVDENSVEVDQNSETVDVQSVGRDIETLNSDFQRQQSAEAAIPSYQPSGALSASQVSQVEQQATNANANADAKIADALKQAKGWVGQANQYAANAAAYCT